MLHATRARTGMIAALVSLAGLAGCQSAGSGTAVSSFAGFEASTTVRTAVQPAAPSAEPDSGTTLTRRTTPKERPAATSANGASRTTVTTVAYAPQDDRGIAGALRPVVGEVEGLPGVASRKPVSSKTTITTKPKRSAKRTRRGGSYAARRKRYKSLIAKHARANGVPLRLAMAIVEAESTFRADARGAAGEIGLMQLMPRTARFIGYKGSMKKLYNPDTNLRYGMKYLGKAHKLAGGSTCGTILKYNAGHGAKRMNPISKRYCRRVSRMMKSS